MMDFSNVPSPRRRLALPIIALALIAAAGCVEQERRSSLGTPGYWNTASSQSSPYGAGVPRLTPDSQRVDTSDRRLHPAVPDIMEHDSDYVGVKRR